MNSLNASSTNAILRWNQQKSLMMAKINSPKNILINDDEEHSFLNQFNRKMKASNVQFLAFLKKYFIKY